MQGKGSTGSADHEFGAERNGLQDGFEGRLTHAHGDHDGPFVAGRAGERKSAEVIAFRLVARICEGKIGVLTTPECKAGTVRIKPKGHGASGDSLSVH